MTEAITGWDRRFSELAVYLSSWSKETGNRVGAVIVGPDNEIRSTGFNGLPRGVDDHDPERHRRNTGAKHIWSSHAERNAIYNAARIGVSVSGCRIYSNYFPCVECAKAIIQSGIAEVISPPPDFTDEKWGVEFRIAGQMFSEAGVVARVP